MGGLFGGSTPKPPVPKPVAPAPTVTSEMEEEALKQASRRRGGFKAQIITGDLVPTVGGSKTLG